MKLSAGQLPQGPRSLCVPLQGVSKASLDSSQAHNDPISTVCANWGFEEPVWVKSCPIGQAAKSRIWARVLRGSRVWGRSVLLSPCLRGRGRSVETGNNARGHLNTYTPPTL